MQEKTTKSIKLTQEKVTSVDFDDFEGLNKHKWTAIRDTNTFYAARHGKVKIDGNRNLIYMHRVILNTPKEMKTDHIDGDGLNNQRKNLRICTDSQNAKNRNKQSDNTSGFKGVSWHKKSKKWRVFIGVNGKQIHLGYFLGKIEAYNVYCNACKKYHGEFSKF